MASHQVLDAVHHEFSIHHKPTIQCYEKEKQMGKENQPHQLEYKNFVDF